MASSKPLGAIDVEQSESPLLTLRVLERDARFEVDETFQCPSEGIGDPTSKDCVLTFDAVRDSAKRGCPRCMLYCNLIRASRRYTRIARVQNPHHWTNPLGIRVKPFGDSNIRDASMWLQVHHMQSLKPDTWQRVDVFALQAPEHATFGFYGQTIHDSLSVSRAIPGDTRSPETINMALKWIRDCIENHKDCGDTSSSILPMRVLDVSSYPIRLYEPNGQPGIYICLSHCWGPKGKSDLLRTTKAELSAFTQEIPWSRIPQTFRDAIHFVRCLQVKYLWIDSLCIIQDDLRDWEQQAGLMADIYANCHVSIAASAAPDADYGLFTRPENLSPSLQVAHGRTTDGAYFPIYARPWICHQIYHSYDFPLYKRGWVLQEMLLSPRTIHFNNAEIAWECRGAIRCECGLDHLGDHTSRPKTLMWENLRLKPDNPKRYHVWRTILIMYSQMSLTYETDTLPALSGLAKRWRTGDSSGEQYLAGLWRADILNELLWERMEVTKRATVYHAPTWSWAAAGSFDMNPVQWSTAQSVSSQDERYADCLDAYCEPRGVDTTGAVQSGYLILRGPSVAASISYKEYKMDVGYPWYDCLVSTGSTAYPFSTDVPVWKEGPGFLPSGSLAQILLIQRCQSGQFWSHIEPQPFWACLVLVLVPGSGNTYMRVGLLRVAETDASVEAQRIIDSDHIDEATAELHTIYARRLEEELSTEEKERRNAIRKFVNEEFFGQLKSATLATFKIT